VGLYYISFAIVIYYRNDNGLFYKTTIVANLTTIVANLALARIVNYDHKVRCKLKRTFTIVNYDPKLFIVQATGVKRSSLLRQRVNFESKKLYDHGAIGFKHLFSKRFSCLGQAQTPPAKLG